jgi:hypothetical protein
MSLTVRRYSEAVKALLATAEADAYATSLQEAVEICIEAATGKRKGGEVIEKPAPQLGELAS